MCCGFLECCLFVIGLIVIGVNTSIALSRFPQVSLPWRAKTRVGEWRASRPAKIGDLGGYACLYYCPEAKQIVRCGFKIGGEIARSWLVAETRGTKLAADNRAA